MYINGVVANQVSTMVDEIPISVFTAILLSYPTNFRYFQPFFYQDLVPQFLVASKHRRAMTTSAVEPL